MPVASPSRLATPPDLMPAGSAGRGPARPRVGGRAAGRAGPLIHAAARGLGLLLAWLALLLAAAPWAQAQQPVPALTARVMDQAGLLDAGARGALEAKLADFEARRGAQIVLLLVASTQPEDIASYAQRVGDAWKIGRRDVGDGLLLVVARDDRKLWIATTKALEGAVPDLAARQIIQQHISPAFKRGDYAAGLNAGVDALMARISGENLPLPEQTGDDGGPGGFSWEDLAVFFFVGVPIIGTVLTGMLGRRLGSFATGGVAGGVAGWLSASLVLGVAAGIVAVVLVGLLGIGAGRGGRGGPGGPARRYGRGAPPVILGDGSGWGGGGWGGGGGGGFSSGGGGDFGGGGAGGDW